MQEVNYRKLKGQYKTVFDQCALKMISSKDDNPFKLMFNDRLLEIFLEHQAKRKGIGLSVAADIMSNLYPEVERQYYNMGEKKIRPDKIFHAVKESDFFDYDRIKNEQGRGYRMMGINLIVNTATMNDLEISLIESSLNCKNDISCHMTSVPFAMIYKQKKTTNRVWLENWAKMTIREKLIKHMKSIGIIQNEYDHTIKEKIKLFALHIYATQLI